MDLLQKEHERLWKRTRGSKSINDVQATIDLLQEARNTVATGRSSPATIGIQPGYHLIAWLDRNTNRLFSNIQIQAQLPLLWRSYKTQSKLRLKPLTIA